ncbi:YqhA family protein [Persephonella sp.]
MEKIIERILWESRLMIFLAVIASIFAAFVLVLIGTFEILYVIKSSVKLFASKDVFDEFYKYAIKHIVTAVDIYLISTVLLIFGIGLYELFISKIDYIEQEEKSSKILEIHTLDQLKEKLAKVILMVLIVTFFKYAIDFQYKDIKSLLYLSIGIALISLSIYLMHKGKEKKQ